MKKNILFAMMLALVAVVFTGCSKDSEDKSTIIEYPKLIIQGDAFYINPIGTTYFDQGCKATYNGEDYSSHVVVTGLDDVDVNTAGLYPVTYTAISPDGFIWSETRTVAVCDPSITTDLSGTWKVQEGSYRNYDNGGEVGFDDYAINISQLAPGIFSVSDFLGGWYAQRANYGKDYAMKGNLQLLADTNLNGLSALVTAWGDSWDSFSGVYDPKTETLTWDISYAKLMVFHIILKK